MIPDITTKTVQKILFQVSGHIVEYYNRCGVYKYSNVIITWDKSANYPYFISKHIHNGITYNIVYTDYSTIYTDENSHDKYKFTIKLEGKHPHSLVMDINIRSINLITDGGTKRFTLTVTTADHRGPMIDRIINLKRSNLMIGEDTMVSERTRPLTMELSVVISKNDRVSSRLNEIGEIQPL